MDQSAGLGSRHRGPGRRPSKTGRNSDQQITFQAQEDRRETACKRELSGSGDLGLCPSDKTATPPSPPSKARRVSTHCKAVVCFMALIKSNEL